MVRDASSNTSPAALLILIFMLVAYEGCECVCNCGHVARKQVAVDTASVNARQRTHDASITENPVATQACMHGAWAA